MQFNGENLMAGDFGNPQRPCVDIERSKQLIETIGREGRARAERGLADPAEIEVFIRDLRTDIAENVGMVCGRICSMQQRCMMDTFGATDPLLNKKDLTPDEKKELEAKRAYDELRAMSEMSLGIFLG